MDAKVKRADKGPETLIDLKLRYGNGYSRLQYLMGALHFDMTGGTVSLYHVLHHCVVLRRVHFKYTVPNPMK